MKLSICIPVYRAESYVERCARSLLTQTCSDLECVFVDDCSPDGSVAVLSRLLDELDPKRLRSRIIRLPENGGRVAARFAALKAATGDYVGFVDADDWVKPTYAEALLRAAQRENADAAVCAYCDVASDGSESAPRRVASYEVDPRAFVAKSFYSPGFNSLCNKIFRRESALLWLTDDMPDLCVGEDLLMTMRFLSRAKRLAFVDEVLYAYRKTDLSISRELSRRTVSDMATCIRTLAAEFPALPKAALDVMRVHALWAACRCRELTNGEVRELAREFAIAFAAVGNVPVVKRHLLPFCQSAVGLTRACVRLIEGARRVVA